MKDINLIYAFIIVTIFLFIIAIVAIIQRTYIKELSKQIEKLENDNYNKSEIIKKVFTTPTKKMNISENKIDGYVTSDNENIFIYVKNENIEKYKKNQLKLTIKEYDDNEYLKEIVKLGAYRYTKEQEN